MHILNPRQEEPCPKLAAALHSTISDGPKALLRWMRPAGSSILGLSELTLLFSFKILILIPKMCVYVCIFN